MIAQLVNYNNKNQIPLYKTFSAQRTFAYRAVSLWNPLDKGLQSSTSVKAFKCSLKTSMLNERGNQSIRRYVDISIFYYIGCTDISISDSHCK